MLTGRIFTRCLICELSYPTTSTLLTYTLDTSSMHKKHPKPLPYVRVNPSAAMRAIIEERHACLYYACSFLYDEARYTGMPFRSLTQSAYSSLRVISSLEATPESTSSH